MTIHLIIAFSSECLGFRGIPSGPKYVDTYLSTKSTYCNHTHPEDFKNCLHTCPTSGFPLDEKGKHNPTNNTWHWLFYGSHSPALGASVATCEKFKSMSSGENVISYGTPAVRAALIPDKYANQRGTRTNARIATLNAMLVNCIGHNEFMDLFSPTFCKAGVRFSGCHPCQS